MNREHEIAGTVVLDSRTKRLCKRITPGQIALINHRDLDRMAAKALLKARVRAVINVDFSISGRYPNPGPRLLLERGIVILDNCNRNLFNILNEGDKVRIEGEEIKKLNEVIGWGHRLTLTEVKEKIEQARENLNQELDQFIENTLTYALREKEFLFDLELPEVEVSFKNRQALIVVRGSDYREDLKTVRSYIREMKPVIIAVDGGADACLDLGIHPDIIVGDMDSISDRGLKCGSELIVHAYPDGRAPGLKRVKKLGLRAEIFPAPGTSEDIALLLAHEKGAELITAVGTHTGMIDFLEKGRPGMASTMLVRLKIGGKLIDVRGLNRLYKNRIYNYYWLQVMVSILLPISILGIFSPPLKNFIQLLVYRFQLIFHF